MRLRAGAATDAGRVRKGNEDAYGVRPDQGLFVVCDGMGGAASGEVASRIAVDTILGCLADEGAAAAAEGVAARISGRTCLPHTRRLREAVRAANARIYDESQNDERHAGMGTTVVGAWIRQGIAGIAHVGDSRAYLYHRGRLEALTRDHSLVEEEVRAGLLDRETSLRSEQQNVLLRALGRDADVDVEVTEVPVQAGDCLLLCTDGLTRMVAEDDMGRAIAQLGEPQRICDHLVAAANDNGGPDNVTVVIARPARAWWRVWDRRG